jgi:hypothetical protein
LCVAAAAAIAASAAAIAMVPGTVAAGPIPLAPKGQKAVLDYSIEIEGSASGSNKNGEYERWSTRRSLVVKATLVAMQPTGQDPGDPGGPHAAARRPKNQAFEPSSDMKAMLARMEKCGEDMACRMKVSQEMMQNPQIQADMQKAKKSGEASRDAPPRYQAWIADSKSGATGSIKLDVQRDQLFKTATTERETCGESAELPLEKLLRSSSWPTTINIDSQAGTYSANIGGVGLTIISKTDCVNHDARGRTEGHSQSGTDFLPQSYQQGTAADIEAFRGETDVPAVDRRLAHGTKVLTGVYGTVMGGVPMTAKVTVRWSVTLLKD